VRSFWDVKRYDESVAVHSKIMNAILDW